MKKGNLIAFVIITIVWLWLSSYFFMPTLSFSASTGIYWNLLIYFILCAFAFYDYGEHDFTIPCITSIVGVCVIVLGLLVGGFFSTSEWVNNSDFRNQIGKIESSTFAANVQAVDVRNMIIVDDSIAERVGQKVLGSDPGLGSRCELGSFTLQTIKGQLYWISPLLHSGFWKWYNFSDEGTPGYVMVSATNPDDYRLVTHVNGHDIHIKYQTGSWWSMNLGRHLYKNGYSSSLYTDKTFEVGDNLEPYWTVTLYDSKIGFRGDDAIGVAVVNPETGEIKEYDIENAPKWIDRIQPEEFVKNQVGCWGEYVHGYFNWSGRDKLSVTSESSLVLGNDGRSYYYFGLTSAGKDDATVGFVMVDTRTKKSHWFRQKGATEPAAKASAEGAVQEKGYHGSNGITYNIDGHATYEFLLKDKAGLMKLIALVNVEEYSIVGIGESRQEALQDYRNKLNSRGNLVSISASDMNQAVVSSKIFRISSEVVRGNTTYKIILDKMPKTLFVCNPSVSDEISFTKEGDMVTISYLESNSNYIIAINKFDNSNISLAKDVIQSQSEKKFDALRDSVVSKKSEEVIDNKINNLSKDEKKKLLKMLNK